MGRLPPHVAVLLPQVLYDRYYSRFVRLAMNCMEGAQAKSVDFCNLKEEKAEKWKILL